jgi:lipopolysaccharide export LptBFGC system permease protein LptF
MKREISFFADFWAIARYEIIYILRDWFFRISAAVAIISLTIFSFLIFNEPAPTHQYTKAEIELAENQLKQSLAIVGKVFTKAEKNFSEDILNKQLNKKLSKGYYLVNNILTGG